ncbi:hypothetical protein J5N97_017170 [Dioscorea zingiberensis]|uniref:Uncharacterized protein n=1 Tax=Dioscorea zingiberensis TaxID=325984 RepID=A0A9D5CNC9_9LILI|nr:hypothetical protein J5N97_017170 [Dioscorea zingiberensis]
MAASRRETSASNVTRVCPEITSTTPQPNLKLSFFDVLWLGIPPVTRLLLYPSAPPLRTASHSLISSLSLALSRFLPLSGRLAASDEVEIAFSGNGIALLEAEAEGEIGRIANDDVHDWEAFRSLVPDLEAGELLAVQVTEFAGGGLALGFAFSHLVADGRSIWSFVEAWADTCRAGGVMKPEMAGAAVVYDRSLIVYPSEAYLNLVSSGTPNYPDDVHKSGNIKSLKERAASTTTTVSTFVAIVSHIWITAIQAKKLNHEDTTILVFFADCRDRLQPPLGPNFFGNCVKICTVKAMSGDLIKGGDHGLSFACMALQEEIRKVGENPLEELERWTEVFSELSEGRMVVVSASPRFRVYDMDFGWGRPGRVELVCMTLDGHVALVEGKEEGSVQVSIALPPSQMDVFASLFHLV